MTPRNGLVFVSWAGKTTTSRQTYLRSFPMFFIYQDIQVASISNRRQKINGEKISAWKRKIGYKAL